MLASNTTKLPTPDQRPGAAVVIYDGQCGFCRANVERFHRWDRQNQLTFLSLHEPHVAERYPDLTRDRLLAEMVIVDSQGRRHGGHEALRYLSRRLKRLWPLAPLLHLPLTGPLWKSLYGWIAKRRYRLGGGQCDDGTCAMH